MKHWVRWLALALALGLVAAACGDDDDDDDAGGDDTTTTAAAEETTTTEAAAEETTTTEAAAEETTTTEAAPELTLDEPVRIVLLAEDVGESVNAIPGFADGIELAVNEINEAGGVGGLDIEFERITTPLDPAAAQTAVLQGIDADPTAMLGPVSSGQILAVAANIASAGIPTIYLATAPQALVGAPDSVANEYAFLGRPPQVAISEALVRAMIEEVGITQIGLICVNNPFGTAGCEIANRVVGDYGGEIVAQESVEANATDYTTQVLSLQSAGAEGLVTYIFPNAVAALHNALTDNGFDIPQISGSTGIIAGTGAITTGNVANLYGMDDCAPIADPRTQEWAEAFVEEYDYTPNYLVAETYDGVYMIKAAVEAAGSTDHDAVRDALAELEYEGICGTYRGEPSQGLNHTLVVTSYDADELPQIVTTYEFDDYTF